MMVAHPAGTEADFPQNVDGTKMAHTAGTETESGSSNWYRNTKIKNMYVMGRARILGLLAWAEPEII